MKNWFEKFKSGVFTKSQVVTGVTLTMITTSALVYAVGALNLNIFSPGDTIKASKVNENFAKINDALSKSNNAFAVNGSGVQQLTSAYSWNYSAQDYLNITNADYDFTPGTLGKNLADANVKQFVVSDSGWYQVMILGKIATPTSIYQYIKLWKKAYNSASFNQNIGSLQISPYCCNYGVGQFQNNYYLNSGDVIAVKAFRDNGPANPSSAPGARLDLSKSKVIFKKL